MLSHVTASLGASRALICVLEREREREKGLDQTGTEIGEGCTHTTLKGESKLLGERGEEDDKGRALPNIKVGMTGRDEDLPAVAKGSRGSRDMDPELNSSNRSSVSSEERGDH